MPPTCGIDLGTSGSSIGFVDAGLPHVVAIEGSSRLSTGLFGAYEVGGVRALAASPAVARPLLVAVLRRLVSACVAEGGFRPSRAIVAVPQGFPASGRGALRQVLDEVGLELAALVPEPLAVAIAHAHGQDLYRWALVCEVGASSFRACLLEQSGAIGEIVASAEEPRMGGIALSQAILVLASRQAAAADATWRSGQATERLKTPEARAQADRALRALSVATTTTLPLALGAEARALHKVLAVELRRDEIEKAMAPALLLALDGVASVVSAADRSGGTHGHPGPSDVLLAGGAAGIPLVWHALQERFGFEASLSIPLEEVVVLGATCLGAMLDGQPVHGIPVDVAPRALSLGLGTGLEAGRATHFTCVTLVPAGVVLPATRSEMVRAPSAAGRLKLPFFFGSHANPLANRAVGEISVGPPRDTPGRPREVIVTARCGLDGRYTIHAEDLASGDVATLVLAADAREDSDLRKRFLGELLEAGLVPGDGSDTDPFLPDVPVDDPPPVLSWGMADVAQARAVFLHIVAGRTHMVQGNEVALNRLRDDALAGLGEIDAGRWEQAVVRHRAIRSWMVGEGVFFGPP
jgi:molecular chaperone DnaK